MKARSYLMIALVFLVAIAGVWANGEAEAEGPQVLRFISQTNGDAERNAFGEVIEMFEAENEGIMVEYEAFAPDTYYTVRETRIASQEVDVVILNVAMKQNTRQWKPLAEAGRILPLDEEPYIDRFPTEILSGFGGLGSRIYGVPLTSYSFTLFYNKDLLNDLGVGVPVTWSEFMDTLARAQESGYVPVALGNREGWPLSLGVGNLVYETLGSDMLTTLDEQDVDTLTRAFTRLFEKFDQLAPYYSEGAAGQAYDTGFQQFASGEAVFTIDGTWRIAQLSPEMVDFEVGVTSVPYDDSGDMARAQTKADMLLTAVDSGNADIALEFIRFLMRPDVHGTWNMAMSNSPLASGVTVDGLPQLTQDVLELPKSPDTVTLYPKAGIVISGGTVASQMLTGEITSVEAAATAVVDRFEASRPNWEDF